MDKRAALRKTEPHHVCDVVRVAMKWRSDGTPTNEFVMSDVWLDPAEAATEGNRRIVFGKALAEYALAPIPGGWAWQALARSHHSQCSTPWMGPEPDREAALAQTLAYLQRAMREGLDERVGHVEAKPADVRKVLAELEDPDFIEPEPMAKAEG